MISFIIPTLNEESVLENILKWLSGFNGEHEIIVSDGKSNDRTIEIANKYADKVVIYNGQRRQTIGMGRNLGASAATGEYLVFLDADVTIPSPDFFFAKAISIMNNTKNCVALTAFMRVTPSIETLADRIFFGIVNYSYLIYNDVLRIGGASGEFQMVRADAFKKVGGFDEEMIGGEDHDHFRRLAKIGRTVFATNLTIYHTGRRPHKVGWPRLLMIWSITLLPMRIRKLFLKEWKVIR